MVGRGLRLATVLGVAALLLTACHSPPQRSALEGTQAPSPAKPPQIALPLDTAVASLTQALVERARDLSSNGQTPRSLVIDPLIDHETGSESAATRSMEERIMTVIRERYPQIAPELFTSSALDQQPLILVGSITTVAGPGVVPTSIGGPTKAYRIWAVLADLRTGRIVSHETAWVQPETVDATPTAFFRESPAWLQDPVMAAYLKTCDAKVGEPIPPAFLASLATEAALAEGIRGFEQGRYRDALNAYLAAQRLPAGDQLRVHNGVYLATKALGQQREAEQAFGQVVEYGLNHGKLAMKLVFRPNSTAFWPDPIISGSYPMWLRQIAMRTARRDACLQVIGHTSPTGPSQHNQVLSEERARMVRTRLVRITRQLQNKTEARGVGSSEPLIGTGRDDATDLLDRRVDFSLLPCGADIRADAA